MKRHMVIFVYILLWNTGARSHNTCKSHDFYHPFNGRYCPTEGIITSNVSGNQCKLYCLHSSNCQAVSYNFTNSLCTHHTATCPLTMNHPDTAFALFSERQPECCIDWMTVENGHSIGDRSVSVDNERFVSRMQKNGSDFVGYLMVSYNNDCLSKDGEETFHSADGYPCQYMKVRDGCTVYFVGYEPGAPLPPNAVIGGYTAEGLPAYIGLHGVPRYYIPGSERMVIEYSVRRNNLKILVSL